MTPSEDSPLADVPRTAAGHRELVTAAAVFRLLAHVRAVANGVAEDDGEAFEAFPVLVEYFVAARRRMPERVRWADSAGWWRRSIEAWEAESDGYLPLRELGAATGLGFEASIVVALVGAVEDDLRLGAVYAALQATPGTRRPCLGLVESLTDLDGAVPSTAARLLAAGWLIADDADVPRAERTLRLPAGVWDAAGGRLPQLGLPITRAADAPALDALVLDDAAAAALHRLPALLADGRASGVVLRGPDGSGRRSALRAVARELGRDTVDVRWPDEGEHPLWRAVAPACRLARLAPIVSVEGAPGHAVEVPRPAALDGAFVGFAIGREGGVRGAAAEGAVHLDLRSPSATERARVWHGALDADDDGLGQLLGESFHLTPGNIHRAAGLARSYAALEGRARPDVPDVQRALRALNRHAFDALARRVEGVEGWDAVVVGAATRGDLEDLEARCRARERLPERAGPAFSGSLNRGVRALFNGPSGTGKTLAARVLAGQLSMDLYRVDLAAVVNKYIGETEKNLDRILSRAEELDVVLLIDEGDAVLASRTDVKTSTDRYANLETNYLLQRLETYEGILLVTTNAGSRIDQAFLRRFDTAIDFAPPGPRERLAIWRAHLPADHAVDRAALRRVAARAGLTGGQIRGAALHATQLAVAEGEDAPITAGMLDAALRREYRRAGAAFPMRVSTAPAEGRSERSAARVRRVLAGLG